jgi:hypothetical protein
MQSPPLATPRRAMHASACGHAAKHVLFSINVIFLICVKYRSQFGVPVLYLRAGPGVPRVL